MIIEDPDERTDYDDELVVVLDDWIDGTGTDPDLVLADLQKTGMPSMGDMDAEAGVTPVTPLGADGGDVTYPYYLINGRVTTDPRVMDYRAGQRIRLRVINAASDTAFRRRCTEHLSHRDPHRRLPGGAPADRRGHPGHG